MLTLTMTELRQVLVVEDEDTIRTLLMELLTEAGDYRVITTSTAENALLLLQQTKFDLVILDLGLPRMSGNELLAAMQTLGLDVPVIISSANTNRLQATPQVRRVVPKPYDIEQMLDAVEATVQEIQEQAKSSPDITILPASKQIQNG